MIAYELMDADVRCFTLIGQFMWHWAYMENSLDDAVGLALELDTLAAIIVTQNMGFSNKVSALTAALSIAGLTDVAFKENQKFLKGLFDLYSIRNIIAHDTFGPSSTPDKSVLFLKAKAKGKIEFPRHEWSATEFQVYFKRLDEAEQKIVALGKALKGSPVKRVAEAILAASHSQNYGGSFLAQLMGSEASLPENSEKQEADNQESM